MTENAKIETAPVAPAGEEVEFFWGVDEREITKRFTYQEDWVGEILIEAGDQWLACWISYGGRVFPPPSTCKLEGKWLVRGKLFSTARGGHKFWVNLPFPAHHLGRFRPYIEFIATNPTVKRGFSDLDKDNVFGVVQKVPCEYISVYTTSAEPTPKRRLALSVRQGEYIGEQGHLKIWRGTSRYMFCSRFYGHKKFLNHELIDGTVLDCTNIFIDRYQLVAVVYMFRDGWVVSPDHPLDAVKLPKGWYIFTHPEPSNDGVD